MALILDKSYLDNNYDVLSTIGSGGFGTVVKVRHKIDEQIYALKHVEFDNTYFKNDLDNILKEVSHLARLRSEYCVQYYNSWIESNKTLFIQMEFCPQNLRNILDLKAQVFDRQSDKQPMDCFEYYISCLLFKEVLQCVQYLHELNPPVIHRDIKPANIMISQYEPNIKRRIKLGDFGLAVVHKKQAKDVELNTISTIKTYPRLDNSITDQHNKGVGSIRYIAPEVKWSESYDHKCDLYSAGLVAREIFDINIYEIDLNKMYTNNDKVLNKPVNELQKLLVLMVTGISETRPECRELLAAYKDWSIDESVIIKNPDKLNQTLQTLQNHENLFFYEFIASNLLNSSNKSKKNRNQQIFRSLFNKHYENTFNELQLIGSDGFGTVFKVKNKLDEKLYAVKIITITSDFDDKSKDRLNIEIKHLETLGSDYCVYYHNSWMDTNILYIQMEFCSHNLRNILDLKAEVFGKHTKTQPMNCFEYYISCLLFKQLLDCVRYLHELDKPVIHRDLKPENILITDYKPGIKQRVKLCDFGLAVVHERRIHSRTTRTTGHNKTTGLTADVGTLEYQAPEVNQGKTYNHKSDIFSLCLIGGEIFDFNLTEINTNKPEIYSTTDEVLNQPMIALQKQLDSMYVLRWRERPECREVLAAYKDWSITELVINENPHKLNQTLDKLKYLENKLFFELLQTN